MEPAFFATPAALRKWLKKNHLQQKELLVGLYKAGSGKGGITWKDLVNELLCFGWIDSTGRRIDEERFSIRCTPRKPGSVWSAINIEKVEEFKKLGLMQPAGLAAYEKRQESKSKIYSHENAPAKLSPAHSKKFKANAKAWKWFTGQAPSYQRTCLHWVTSAKQQATRDRRLDALIADSAAGQRMKQFNYPKK